ncbi:hypothetical protein LQE96_06040 [Phocea massiliensis]|jgi:hypothetical protein|uniref:hypothetical protein n=1 Tax=Merdimmobilis hominis TaxID=2897707 RepID=UPI00116044A0|nr:hypothetical protein [Merdimmobilis hominis]MCD4836383.1 hypothetical protein [Merdimmobilis hominis]
MSRIGGRLGARLFFWHITAYFGRNGTFCRIYVDFLRIVFLCFSGKMLYYNDKGQQNLGDPVETLAQVWYND